MSMIASRDLRNHTAKVLEEVSEGGHVIVTVHGRAVAEIIPVQETRPMFISTAAFLSGFTQADPGLSDDLRALGDESSDTVGPLP